METVIKIKTLTHRELEVIMLVNAGASYKMVGNILSISLYTVKRHIDNIFKKTNANSITKCLNNLRQQGIL